KRIIYCCSCHFLFSSDTNHLSSGISCHFHRQIDTTTFKIPVSCHEFDLKYISSPLKSKPHWNHYDFSGVSHYINLSARILLLSMHQEPAGEFLQPLHL